MANDAERLIEGIAIESYIQKFVALKRRGVNLLGLCPFHNEKTPSFTVSPEKRIFKCFGCGKGGNILSFTMEYEKVSFPEALKVLSEFSGIELERRGRSENKKIKQEKEILHLLQSRVARLYHQQLKESEAYGYLKARGIKDETITYFELGFGSLDYQYLEKKIRVIFQDIDTEPSRCINWLVKSGLIGRRSDSQGSNSRDQYNRFRARLIFPIKNLKAEVIGFGGRILQEGSSGAKYVNTPDSPVFLKKNNLYNIDKAKESIRENSQAILVEGYFDVIGLHAAGIKNSVAPLGTAFTKEQARILKRYTDNIIIFLDADNAGIEAAFKALKISQTVDLTARIVVQQNGTDGKDPFDLARELDQIDLMQVIDNGKDAIAFILWYMFSHLEKDDSFSSRKKSLEKFFEYLLSLKSNWEINEYIKRAAKLVATPVDLLFKDFEALRNNRSSKKIVHNEAVKAPVVSLKQEKIPRFEMEILVLLLKNPLLWEKSQLIDLIYWKGKSSCLLFSFFRDRMRVGEVWSWQHLDKVINNDIYDEELKSLLSGILLQYDSKDSQRNETSQENISKMFENLVYTSKINELDEKVVSLREKLIRLESIDDINELEIATKKIENILQQKGRFVSLREKNS